MDMPLISDGSRVRRVDLSRPQDYPGVARKLPLLNVLIMQVSEKGKSNWQPLANRGFPSTWAAEEWIESLKPSLLERYEYRVVEYAPVKES